MNFPNGTFLTPTEGKNQVENRTSFDVVVLCGLLIGHLPTTKDQPLLWGRNSFLLLHALLDPLDLVGRLDVDLDFLARECPCTLR
eukprot:NODE_2945_length_517_cov_183.089744_g2547_i0.p3 GENE.NODE_2945_length_517_cov_183.089744_g2547_i0~~NODE_2945_length_517_cov_183.089744_g2547_i0.p3  ORF type:complete len:85 (-),score=20.77 NODE_2945_length_517_cov_183.089744_g2547_i0:16-270(-)